MLKVLACSIKCVQNKFMKFYWDKGCKSLSNTTHNSTISIFSTHYCITFGIFWIFPNLSILSNSLEDGWQSVACYLLGRLSTITYTFSFFLSFLHLLLSLFFQLFQDISVCQGFSTGVLLAYVKLVSKLNKYVHPFLPINIFALK